MGRNAIGITTVCALIAGMLAGGIGSPAAAQDEPPGGLLARQWFHAGEFATTPGLRAEPHHTVILHLAAGDGRRAIIRNSIPYHFRQALTFDFCVPDEDPHILALTLTREGSPAPVVHVPRRAPCKTRTIAAGLYWLHIDHDGTRVPAEGVKAFIHVPRRELPAVGETADDSSALRGDKKTLGTTPRPRNVFDGAPQCLGVPFDWGSLNNPMFTLTLAGAYIASPTGANTAPTGILTPSSAPNPLNGWSVCRDASNNYYLFNGVNPNNIRFWMVVNESVLPGIPLIKIVEAGMPPNSATYGFHPQLDGYADWQFSLGPIFSGGSAGLNVFNGNPNTTIIALYGAYRAGAQVPAPQAGQVYLANAFCNQAPAATYVALNSLPSLDAAGIHGFSNVTVRPGPGTALIAYPQVNYAGTPQYITEQTCLTSLPVSIAVVSTNRSFVAAAKSCRACDLTGIDLSGLDLIGGDFTGTVFNQANLTNTNFQSALLDHTISRGTTLTGTDFIGAHLNCADFQSSVLTSATFWLASPLVRPVITRDQSCFVDVQHAQLNWNTFPVDDWRYLYLDSASIIGASAQPLSSPSQPLDLSKARMSGTTGLTSVDLSGAKVGGATLAGTDLTGAKLSAVTSVDPTSKVNIPAHFPGATLTSATLDSATLDGVDFTSAFLNDASLQRVSLAAAVLQGANLNFANLDGANLYSASVGESATSSLSASLNGAFMRNVNLAKANLTGVTLPNANFYSAFPVGQCNPSAANGFLTTCASAVGATLDFTTFENAYLAGTDFSGATAQVANFSGAILVGANFTSVLLTNRPGTGQRAEFNGAWLHGANFTGASVPGADFTGAVANRTQNSLGGTAYPVLADANQQFAGYSADGPPTILGCVAPGYDGTMTPPPAPTTPITCPDGGSATTCTDVQWEKHYVDAENGCNDFAVDFNF